MKKVINPFNSYYKDFWYVNFNCPYYLLDRHNTLIKYGPNYFKRYITFTDNNFWRLPL